MPVGPSVLAGEGIGVLVELDLKGPGEPGDGHVVADQQDHGDEVAIVQGRVCSGERLVRDPGSGDAFINQGAGVCWWPVCR
jgi:hypothetical protein